MSFQRLGHLGFRWGVAFVVLLIDQLTKVWALHTLPYGVSMVVVPGCWSWQLLLNRGAAFSWLAGAPAWATLLLGGVSGVAALCLGAWLARLPARPRATLVAVQALLGGAVGNGLDRWLHGGVVDFISWHLGGWHLPVFNVADVALTLGCLGWLVCQRGARNAVP